MIRLKGYVEEELQLECLRHLTNVRIEQFTVPVESLYCCSEEESNAAFDSDNDCDCDFCSYRDEVEEIAVTYSDHDLFSQSLGEEELLEEETIQLDLNLFDLNIQECNDENILNPVLTNPLRNS